MAMPGEAPPEGLAEVKRVRQFFPETWIWRDITTDESGRAVVPVEGPDSITTVDRPVDRCQGVAVLLGKGR